MRFTAESFESVGESLDRAALWFAGLGIVDSESRLPQLRTRLATLIPDLAGVRTRHEFAGALTNEALYALRDARALSRVFTYFSSLKSHRLPRQKLGQVLRGPLNPEEEDPETPNVEPRNILAELELAADLAERGFEVVDFDDVAIRYRSRLLRFEVKRVHREGQIKQSVQTAVRQLGRKLDASESRGLICIVLDRLIGVDRLTLRVERPDQIIEAAQAKLAEFLRVHGRHFRAPVNTKIIGNCFVLHFFVWDNTLGLPSTAYLVPIVPHVGNTVFEVADRSLLEAFAADAGA